MTSHQPIGVLKCIETTAILVHQTNPFFWWKYFFESENATYIIQSFGSNPFCRLANLNFRDLKVKVFQHFCQTANIKKS